MVAGGSIEYRLICLPDTRDVSVAVNELLKENKDKHVELPPLQVADRYQRGTEARCPKCGGTIETSKSSTLPLTCTGCRRSFQKDEVENLTKTTFTRAGNFFIQPVIIKSEG